MQTGAASVECVWDHRKASAAIQNPKFAMILADWNFVMQTGEDYDNDDSPKRQKSRSVSRANSLRGLNFLKSIQSMPVETPIVFMHFDAEVDEVKRTLVTTRTPDQKRRNYIITKPLQVSVHCILVYFPATAKSGAFEYAGWLSAVLYCYNIRILPLEMH